MINSDVIKGLSLSVAVCALIAFAPPASAQIAQQSGIADPGRAQEDFRKQLAIPQETPNIAIQEMALQGAPEGAENIRFNFGGLEIEGAEVYSKESLADLYQDKIGTEMTLADLYALANAMTLKYRNDGYILTQVVVPPQTIEGGIAKLQVVEGYINSVSVQASEGEPESAMRLVRAYAENIPTGVAANVRDLERHLLLINDLPGLSARSVISPSANAPGGADIDIVVERDPFDGQIGIDNYGSRYLGPVQLGTVGTLNSALGMNETITGQVVIAPQSWYEMAYAALEYRQPIGRYGTTVSGLLSYTDTEPGYDLEQFDVVGKSKLFSMKVEHPFIRSRNENLGGRLLLDIRNTESDSILTDTRDHIRALRAGIQYDFLDRLLGVAANTFDLEVSKGVSLFGASDSLDANLSRALGDPQFAKGTLEFQRLQRLTDQFNLLIGGRGQISNGPLLSSEEFSVGGNNSGRGYDPSEIVGDEGVSGKAELQWNNPVPVMPQAVEKYQLFTFYDVGRVWNDDATTSSDKKMSLASAGAGVRVNFVYDIDASLGFAVPLTRGVQTQNGDNDTKVYFNLSKKF